MSFLLSLFFAVLIASTMGLPQSWVFFAFRFYRRSFTEWAPAVLGLFHEEVVSARLNPSHSTIDVRRVYASQFLSRHNNDLERQRALGS